MLYLMHCLASNSVAVIALAASSGAEVVRILAIEVTVPVFYAFVSCKVVLLSAALRTNRIREVAPWAIGLVVMAAEPDVLCHRVTESFSVNKSLMLPSQVK